MNAHPTDPVLTDQPALDFAWLEILRNTAPCIPADLEPAKPSQCDQLGVPFHELPMCQ